MKLKIAILLFFVVLFLAQEQSVTALRITGKWDRNSNWSYLTKFCFKKTSKTYGNFSWFFQTNSHLSLSFYDDDSKSWEAVYKSNLNCAKKRDKSIAEREVTSTVFGFERFEDITRDRYWYFALSDCSAKSMSVTDMDIHIWNPVLGSANQEFSCENQGILTLIIIFFVFFLLLGAVLGHQLWKIHKNGDIHTYLRIYAIAYFFQILAIIFTLGHYGSYANNGKGSVGVLVFGEILFIVSQILMMLMLIFIGQGWTISHRTIHYPKMIIGFCVLIAFLDIFLMIAAYVVFDEGSQYIAIEAVPGIMLLIVRIFITVVFGYFIRKSYMIETNAKKKRFYKFFGIVALFWFIWIPFFGLVGLGIPKYVRPKVINGMFWSCDFLMFTFLLITFHERFSKGIFFMKADDYLPQDNIKVDEETWSNTKEEHNKIIESSSESSSKSTSSSEENENENAEKKESDVESEN
ncbi:intimal thickness receptor-related [Anaeramoeba flamelloides]|uniref:Intimal thickness receptor-related n=1 Tax=Anaeramoeba flamelloides TaxID=1746091 RepID=A0ABQ8YKP0_9EUKA|nr:intimal thickness receptor-related [Anaeramoeba flamelloides]